MMATIDDRQDRESLARSLDNTLRTEAAGLAALREALHGPLGAAAAELVDRTLALSGRLVVCGMGKSGHIGRKIAATLASTGTPSLFMHPAEASHGDLGMVTRQDAVLALSWSGETRELADITSYTRRYEIGFFAMTAAGDSTLARAADVSLVLPRVEEACPNGLAPTSSTLLQLAFGDAIAVALLERRRFSSADFRVFHPGGNLGSMLLTVRDVMRPRERVARVAPDAPVSAAILEMTRLSIGCAVVEIAEGEVAGIITDGDLRRHMNEAITSRRAEDIMTRSPLSIGPETLASEALARMAERRVLVLLVEENGRFEGVLTIADLMARGLSLPSNTL